jgi:hypothetical protein
MERGPPFYFALYRKEMNKSRKERMRKIMVYLIVGELDGGKQPALIQTLIDYAWDAFQICVAPHRQGLLVDFGEPLLDGALDRLVKQVGKLVRPVAEDENSVDWQVVYTDADLYE